MKNNFNKKLVMTKEVDDNFENSAKCWICDNVYLDGYIKLRKQCRITGKYRSLARRYCNINVLVNNKIPIVFHNIKNYDSHLIMPEREKLNFKINVIPNELEKKTSFHIKS